MICRFGQLGFNSTTASAVPAQVLGSASANFSAVSACASSACGVMPNGDAFCWGLNSLGQLGSASNDTMLPTQVAGATTFKLIKGLFQHFCAISAAGSSLLCWGSNSDGQIVATNSGSCPDLACRAPTQAASSLSTVWADVAVGTAHSCGLLANASVVCWGSNNAGALGTGTFEASPGIPVKVASSLSFASISAGAWYTCGLTTTRQLFCW